MKVRKRKDDTGPKLAFIMVQAIVEDGDPQAWSLLSNWQGSVVADEMVKVGREVHRELGLPVHVAGLIPERSAA